MTSVVVKALLLNAARLNALRLIKKNQDPTQNDDSPKIVYGIETYDAPHAVKQVQAQFETWGKDVPKTHILIVGGPHDSGPVFPCKEDVRGLICKEATILYRGMQRVREITGDWFIGLHEDSYVDTKLLSNRLRKLDPNKPIVMSDFGCGVAWKHSPDNVNKTLTPPSNWEDVDSKFHQCDAVAKHGALCSGAAFVVSRAALEQMTHGMTLDEFIKAHGSQCPAKFENKCQTDTTTSCFLYSVGVPMSAFAEDLEMEQIDKLNVAARYPHQANFFHLNMEKTQIPEAMQSLHKQLGN